MDDVYPVSDFMYLTYFSEESVIKGVYNNYTKFRGSGNGYFGSTFNVFEI